jgi:hypothetical protein
MKEALNQKMSIMTIQMKSKIKKFQFSERISQNTTNNNSRNWTKVVTIHSMARTAVASITE